MPDCPRCHQPVDKQAIACPYCRTPLKAFGHPGISLHRATGREPLCLTCTYHADDTCNFPQRPLARECTLYNDQRLPQAIAPSRYASDSLTTLSFATIKYWLNRHAGWLILLGLLIFSFAIVASRR